MWVKVVFSPKLTVYICCVYFPPGSKLDKYSLLFDTIDRELTPKDATVLIIGDFNLPKLSDYNSHVLNELSSDDLTTLETSVIEYLNLTGLQQHNAVKNQINNRTLDWVLSNFTSLTTTESIDQIVKLDVHHPCIHVELKLPEKVKEQTVLPSGYNFNKGDYVKLYSEIEKIDWSPVLDEPDVDAATAALNHLMKEAMDLCIPLKKTTRMKEAPSWFNGEIFESLCIKNRLRARYLRTRNQLHYHDFSSVRSHSKQLIKTAYRSHLRNVEKDIDTDPKKFWNFVREKKGHQNVTHTMQYNGVSLENPTQISEAFANYFESVYSKELSLTKSVSEIVACTEPLPLAELFSLSLISDSDVMAEIKKLKPKKSAGTDGIPPYIVKGYGDLLTKPLTHIFNRSIILSKYPGLWKSTIICPIPKVPNTKDICQHRPIGLLCSYAKVFEGIIHNQMFNHFKPLISPCQYGFVPKRSTSTNLINFFQDASEAIGDKTQLDACCTDYKKVFDLIKFDHLLKNLRYLGASEVFLCFLESYLVGRTQCVKFRGLLSKSFLVLSSVGQGSRLGPDLFLFFINGLPEVVKYSTCELFADDFRLYKKISCIEDCQRLQSDIDAICKWSADNELLFNLDKCKIITFTLLKKPITYDYTMEGRKLIRVEEMRDLGVILDSKLTFSKHINAMVSKSFKTLGFIKRTCRFFKNEQTLSRLYCSFVRSQVEYASLVWDPILSNQCNQVERVQKKYIKYVHSKINGVNSQFLRYDDLLNEHNMHSLAQRRECAKILYLHKLLNGKENNDLLLGRFQFNVTRSTRSTDLFYLPSRRVNCNVRAPVSSLSNLANKHAHIDLFFLNESSVKSLLLPSQ